jgi:hypothetical protein
MAAYGFLKVALFSSNRHVFNEHDCLEDTQYNNVTDLLEKSVPCVLGLKKNSLSLAAQIRGL